MKATAKVTALLEDGYAVVETVRRSACADCHNNGSGKCGHCELFFGDDRIECKAVNSAKAAIGDEVVISTRSRNIILNSFLVFVLPILVGLLGYILAYSLGQNDRTAALFFLLFLAIGYVSVFLFTKLFCGKTNTVYITGVIKRIEK